MIINDELESEDKSDGVVVTVYGGEGVGNGRIEFDVHEQRLPSISIICGSHMSYFSDINELVEAIKKGQGRS